jgi:hypothetical protein
LQYKSKTIIKKGTSIRESKCGHYNFHYPAGDPYEAPNDIVCEPKSWVGTKDWQAHQVYVDDVPGRIIWTQK